jgi:hypothetical protein
LQWGLPRRDLGQGDVFAGEDGVEGGGELHVPVADEMGEVGGAVAEVPQELAGLLGGPGCGGAGGDAEDVDGAGAYLHEEQGVQPLQSDGVGMEQIGGE